MAKKKKKYCGDFGGKNRHGEPCGRPAGWRTQNPGKGPCALHPEGSKTGIPIPPIPAQYSRNKKLKTVNDGVMGRPSQYDDDVIPLAYRLCLLGARDVDLAKLLEIEYDTLLTWKQERPELRQAILDGRELADANVALAMYQRAIGFSHPDTHITVYKGDVIETPIEKHYAPSVAAGQLWLFNRQRKYWQDIKKLELDLGLDGVSDEDLLKRLEERRNRLTQLQALGTGEPSGTNGNGKR